MNYFPCLSTCAGILGLAAVLGTNQASAQDTWNFYIHQSAPQFTTSVGATDLAEKITDITDGELTVRRHYAGTLQIDTSSITQAVGQNVVQMGDDLYYSGNIPIAAIIKLPFLVQSYEDYQTASDILRPYVEEAYAEQNVVLLGGYVYPTQYVWGVEEISSLEDIDGKRIRTSAAEQGEFVRRFGGTAVSIGASEVPSALDRGVVAGIITGSVGGELWKDLLNWAYLMGLGFNNAYIIANKDAYDALSPEIQQQLRDAVAEAAAWNLETMRQDDAELIEQLEADMTIVEPTEEERARAAAELAPYWDEWAKERGPEAEKALEEVRTALGR